MDWKNSGNVTWSMVLRAGNAIYFLWWVVTALIVIGFIGLLLKIVFLSWLNLEDWRFFYCLGGASFMLYGIYKIGPSLLSESIDIARKDGLTGIVVCTVIFGSCAVIIIPLVFIGWPLFFWGFWESKDKDK